MSYIVPMKKPICINCPFRSLDSCTLIYLMSDKDSEVTVHVNEMTVSPDCPLVEVEPHDDLVDRGWVRDSINHSCWIEHNDYLEAIGIIDDAPTIIEAEGSEE